MTIKLTESKHRLYYERYIVCYILTQCREKKQLNIIDLKNISLARVIHEHVMLLIISHCFTNYSHIP